MGMSASQAKLMSLTSRLSDLELRAQRIQNDKIRLSDQGEEASKKYSKALDKEVLQLYSGVKADGTSSYVDASMNNLTTFDGQLQTTDKQRFVKDGAGNLLVSDKVATAYSTSNHDLETFLNNLGYSTITPADRFASMKTNYTSKLSTDITNVLSTIGNNPVMVLDSSISGQLDQIAPALSTAQTDLSKVQTAKTTNDQNESIQAGKVSGYVSSISTILTNTSKTTTDSGALAIISGDQNIIGSINTALQTGNTSKLESTLDSLNPNLFPMSAASIYASKNSYLQSSSGAVILTQTLAKCVDSNNGSSDQTLDGGLQDLSTFLRNLVRFGLMTNAGIADTTSSDYKYYVNLYNMAKAKGYQIADSTGTFTEQRTKKIDYPALPATTNENSSTWVQSQVTAGNAKFYKLNPSTGQYAESTPNSESADMVQAIKDAKAEAKKLNDLKTQNATNYTPLVNQADASMQRVEGLFNTLAGNTSLNSDQIQAVKTQGGKVSNARTDLSSGLVDSAVTNLGSVDVNSLYTTLKHSVDVYSSTLSPSQMNTQLLGINDDLGVISGAFTSDGLKQYIEGKQSAVSQLLPGLGGSTTISSDSASSIQQTLSGISVDQIKSSIDSSTLAKTYINDPSATSYYTNLFNELVEGKDHLIGLNKDQMGSSDWLTGQIQAGNIFLYEKDTDRSSSNYGDFINISWNSGDTSLQMVSDKTDLAKAEAEYETTMASIQTKDKTFDVQLTTINTEHKAIETEIDSVKKVIDKNVDRAFKVFDA